MCNARPPPGEQPRAPTGGHPRVPVLRAGSGQPGATCCAGATCAALHLGCPAAPPAPPVLSGARAPGEEQQVTTLITPPRGSRSVRSPQRTTSRNSPPEGKAIINPSEAVNGNAPPSPSGLRRSGGCALHPPRAGAAGVRAGSPSLPAAGARLAAERGDPRRAPLRAAPFLRPKRLLPLAAGAPGSCLRVTVSPPPYPAPSLPSSRSAVLRPRPPLPVPEVRPGGCSAAPRRARQSPTRKRQREGTPPCPAARSAGRSRGGGAPSAQRGGRASCCSARGKGARSGSTDLPLWLRPSPGVWEFLPQAAGRQIAAAYPLAALCGLAALGYPSLMAVGLVEKNQSRLPANATLCCAWSDRGCWHNFLPHQASPPRGETHLARGLVS